MRQGWWLGGRTGRPPGSPPCPRNRHSEGGTAGRQGKLRHFFFVLYAISGETNKFDKSVKVKLSVKSLTIMRSELHDQTYFVLSTTGLRTTLYSVCPCKRKRRSENIVTKRCCPERILWR